MVRRSCRNQQTYDIIVIDRRADRDTSDAALVSADEETAGNLFAVDMDVNGGLCERARIGADEGLTRSEHILSYNIDACIGCVRSVGNT